MTLDQLLFMRPTASSSQYRTPFKNFYLSHQYVSKQIDGVRNNLLRINNPYVFLESSNLRILHITNFNERHNGRLFFNTGRRLNNGFIRLGHSVLEFSDRDIVSRGKSIRDIYGSSTLNDKLSLIHI